MTAAPHDVVEFARMLTRAFYPAEYVVALDGILRGKNYCAHDELARRLNLSSKELRATLVKMEHERLVKSETRMQTRVNLGKGHRVLQKVATEFWFVPLCDVIDVFTFRMQKLGEMFAREDAQWLYRCERCWAEYSEIEVVHLANPDRSRFVCERFFSTYGRKPSRCGGNVVEGDNEGRLKENRSLKKRLDMQLKPLRERAEKCIRLSIPVHPLQNADEGGIAKIVPQFVGIHGEIFDESDWTPGIASDLEREIKLVRKEEDGFAAALTATEDKSAKRDVPVSDIPAWFKNSEATVDEEEDDWFDEV